MSYAKALTNAVRDLLGKNKSRPEIVSTWAPPGSVTETHHRSQVLSYPGSGATTDTQSCLNMELTSVVGEERISNVVGETGNKDKEVERETEFERTGQELEGDNRYDCNLEFPIIERQF